MKNQLSIMRARRGDGGFTLIELLVVVVIIGVLVGIAIPMYMNYRKGAANKSAQSDLRGAITAVEQYYTENSNQYPADAVGSKGVNLTFGSGTSAQTATVSPGNTIALRNDGAGNYVLCSESGDGGGIFFYSSKDGKGVQKSSKTTLALCVAASTP